jgi:actin related protein 2/3 complex subunit 5
MAHATPQTNNRNITPQPTGFSQIHSRGGGEGGGQAMSVLLSWHEKVRRFMSLDLICVVLDLFAG